MIKDPVIKDSSQSWRNISPHSVRHSGRYCLLSMLIYVVTVIVFDVWLLWSWSEGDTAFLNALLLHGFVSSLCLLQSATCWWLRRAWGFGLLTFPLVLVLGPVGAVGILLTALIFAFSRESATPFDVWYEEILPEATTPPEEKMIERLHLWGEEAEEQHLDLVPFADVLVSGSAKEKQSAIDIIVKNYHSSFAAVLRGALNDPVNTVRTHAVAAITRIEEMYQNRTFVLERRMTKHPEKSDNILNLAIHYDEHANAGLSDKGTLKEHRHKAEMLYRQLHEIKAGDTSVLWTLGRLLIRDERSNEALLVFEEALDISSGIAEPQQRIWHWVCLYDLRKFQQLREQVSSYYDQVSREPGLPQSLLDSIELWANNDSKSVETYS